jgi:hypothetical protein
MIKAFEGGEGVARRTEGVTYLVRIGEGGPGKGAGPWGDHIFTDLGEARKYAASVAATQPKQSARQTRAIPNQWESGDVSKFEAVRIFEVPPNTAYWQGVIAAQSEKGTRYAPTKPGMSPDDLKKAGEQAVTLPGGGPQVLLDPAVRVKPVDQTDPGIPLRPGEGPAKGKAEGKAKTGEGDVEQARLDDKELVRAIPLAGGGKLGVTRQGICVICSSPCEWMWKRFPDELNASQDLTSRLARIEGKLNYEIAENNMPAVERLTGDLAALEVELRAARRVTPGFGFDQDQGRVMPRQAEAQLHLEDRLGHPVESLDPVANPRHGGKSGDWFDPASGRSYDAVGPVTTGHFDYDRFTYQIQRHLRAKAGLDITFVDVSGLTDIQIGQIINYLRGMAPGGGALPRAGRPAGGPTAPLTPDERRRIWVYPNQWAT